MLTSTIQIQVETAYLPNHIPPEKNKFAFSYHIEIENQGEDTVQLLNRYWLITDGNGKTSEVAGSGVVGKQPFIAPGEKFAYSSGAVLDTPVGSMQGHFEFQKSDSSLFKAPIDIFSLNVPNAVN